MKPDKIKSIESYFQTDNEHWNEFAFKMLCEALQQAQFDNPETPLRVFNDATELFLDNHKHPLKAIQLFNEEMEKRQLTPYQKLFLYEWLSKYLLQTTYENADLTPISQLIKSQKVKLKIECQPPKALTKNIRETLKEMMQKEIQTLPETLKELEPAQRLNILCKLIPFVLPKVESIHPETGEPDTDTRTFDLNDYL